MIRRNRAQRIEDALTTLDVFPKVPYSPVRLALARKSARLPLPLPVARRAPTPPSPVRRLEALHRSLADAGLRLCLSLPTKRAIAPLTSPTVFHTVV